MMKIESVKDPKVEEAESLTTPLGRKAQGKALLYSRRELTWALSHDCKIEYVLATEEYDVSAPLYLCSEGILKRITGSSYGVPLLAVISTGESEWMPQEPLLIVFEGAMSYATMGTMIRIASAFGIHEFLSTSPERELWQKKTIEASEGTVFAAKHHSFSSPEETIAYLRTHNYKIAVPTLRKAADASTHLLEGHRIALLFSTSAQEISPLFLEAADLKVPLEKDEPLELQMNDLLADFTKKMRCTNL
ncbi:MAG: hypothetical protein JSR80_01890 [Verrucomicrobia bacterium]|nr:hypothetical protein [Verrucomicrobiota bacterium]